MSTLGYPSKGWQSVFRRRFQEFDFESDFSQKILSFSIAETVDFESFLNFRFQALRYAADRADRLNATTQDLKHVKGLESLLTPADFPSSTRCYFCLAELSCNPHSCLE